MMTKEMERELKAAYIKLQEELQRDYLLHVKACATLQVKPLTYSSFKEQMAIQL